MKVMQRIIKKRLLIVILFTVTMCTIIRYIKSYLYPPKILYRSFGPWDDEQARRRSAVQDVCSSLDGISIKKRYQEQIYSLDHLSRNQWLINHLLVDDKHKALYCYIPKVACTSWKRLWFYLAGHPNAKYASDPRLPNKLMHAIAGQTYMLSNRLLEPDEFKYIVQTYRKFLIVRHPYERLVSAYRDKFESNKFTELASAIMHVFRNSSQVPEDGSGLSFSEFVKYITHFFWRFSYTNGGPNEHWRSYLDLCHPCAIDYDYIGKYETLKEDSFHILKALDADHLRLNGSGTNTSHIVDTYMKQLSMKQLHRLQRLYQTDFNMFLYSH